VPTSFSKKIAQEIGVNGYYKNVYDAKGSFIKMDENQFIRSGYAAGIAEYEGHFKTAFTGTTADPFHVEYVNPGTSEGWVFVGIRPLTFVLP
jgi:hypothetical protein